jgi:hypothetical protein
MSAYLTLPAIQQFLRNNPAIATVSCTVAVSRGVSKLQFPMTELEAPDLDLIKQAAQRTRRFGEADPAASLGIDQGCNQRGRFAADLLQMQ